MNPRVARLRQESPEAPAQLSTEQAELMTELDGLAGELSPPMRRALAFKYLLENKTICINPGELIVGERGPAPKATPTYPELCCHSQEDLELLDSREKIPYAVSAEAKRIYAEKIIPHWRGRSMRDLIFAQMTPEWQAAYAAGIFTEFMEQRAPGHTVADDKLYRRGFLDFQRNILNSLAGGIPGSHRAGSRLQRLLLRPESGPAGGDHCPDRASEDVIRETNGGRPRPRPGKRNRLAGCPHRICPRPRPAAGARRLR